MNRITFLKLKRLLHEFGLVSRRPNDIKPTLWQSCHILQKRGKYYIVHFKQLFLLDGRFKKTNFTIEDQRRTQLIACLLHDWGLITLKKNIEILDDSSLTDVVVISFAERENWNLQSKYSIGRKKNYD